MICTIQWNTLSPQDWQTRFEKIQKSNLLQSYNYALAACPIKRQRGRWGLILIDGIEAGLVQILEAGVLANMIHAVTLDCGPLWFDGFGTEEHFEAFIKTFRNKFPKRLGRRVRLIPDMPHSKKLDTILSAHGFRSGEAGLQQTHWINLRNTMDSLRENLRKNWRNMLSRSEREGVEVNWDFKNQHLKTFMQNYIIDKAQKDYGGASVELLVALCKSHAPQGHVLLGRAEKNGAVLGYGLFFIHGKSATYQIGWTSSNGRSIGAQNLLLWNALRVLKEKDIEDLDLGGINDETAKGVKKFKEGMGGDSVILSGLYLG